jgi:PAS domain S-box-containing protein
MIFFQKGAIIFKKPITIGVLTFLSLFLLLQSISYQRYTILKNREQAKLNNQAEITKDNILSLLYDNIYVTKALAYIAQNKGIQDDFDEIAQNILPQNHVIDVLELTKLSVVTHVYPYQQNKSVIGYDIFSTDLHGIPARKAIESKSLYFEGPVKLEQGGIAIIGRLPYFKNQKFAGFAVGIIKLDKILNLLDLKLKSKSDYIFGISKYNSINNTNEFFLSNAKQFSDNNFITENIPSGDWKLHIRPKRIVGLKDVSINIIFGFIVSLLGGLFAWFISAQPQQLKKLVNEKVAELNKNEQLMIKTQKLANVGSWDINLLNKKVTWSKSLFEIFEAKDNFTATLDATLNLFKEGYNRDKINYLINDAIRNKNSFRVELELVTFNKTEKWVRLNGDIEVFNNHAIRLFGAIQDITQEKLSNNINEQLSNQIKEISATIPSVIYQLKINTNNEFSFTYISESVSRLLQLEVDKIYSNANEILNLIHPDDLTIFKNSFLTNIIGKGQSQNFTFRVNINNQILFLNSNATSSLIDNELIWNGSLTDISEIKKAEEEETYLAGLLANIYDAIISTDKDFVIKSWNYGAEQIYGWKAEEVIGRKFHAVLKTQYIGSSREEVRKDFLESGLFNGEVLQIDKFGIFHHIAMSASLLRDKNNKVAGAVSVNKQIDEIKKSQKDSTYKTNLLSTIGLVNSTLLSNQDWLNSLDIAFELIGRSLKTHRIIYYENEIVDGNVYYTNVKLEWVYNDKAKLPENLRTLEINLYDDSIEVMDNHEFFTAITSKVKDDNLKKLFIQKGIKSLISFPVKNSSNKVGYITVEDILNDREWSDEEIYFLKTIINNISSAIQKSEYNEALELANNEKKLILESITDAFFAVDKNWKVTYWNKIAEQLFGYKNEEILGHYIWDKLFTKEDLIFKNRFFDSYNNNQTINFEAFFKEAQIWLEVSAFPSGAGLSIYFKNINERIEYLNAIQKQNQNLKEISWIQSHVVRAPLARLMGLLSIRKDINENEMSEDEYFELITKSTIELDVFIKNIIDKTQSATHKNQDDKIKPSFKE